jgi:acyl carrier protein
MKNLVFNSINDVLLQSNKKEELTLETLIFGKNSILDSLDSIILMADLEEKIQDTFNKTMNIFDNISNIIQKNNDMSVKELIELLTIWTK